MTQPAFLSKQIGISEEKGDEATEERGKKRVFRGRKKGEEDSTRGRVNTRHSYIQASKSTRTSLVSLTSTRFYYVCWLRTSLARSPSFFPILFDIWRVIIHQLFVLFGSRIIKISEIVVVGGDPGGGFQIWPQQDKSARFDILCCSLETKN